MISIAKLVAFAAVTSLALAGTITYKNCTDQALCASGCTSTTVPMDQCLSFTSGSEILTCVPTVRVCGDLTYYSDHMCFNVVFTDGFVCDQCNKDHNGNYNEAVCARATTGVEYLALNACGASASCGSCNNYMNVTRDECIPVNSGDPRWKAALARRGVGLDLAGTQLFAKYTGSITCTAVKAQQWFTNTQCASTPSQVPYLPEDSCIDGQSVHCNWL